MAHGVVRYSSGDTGISKAFGVISNKLREKCGVSVELYRLYKAAELGYVDDVIEPAITRQRVIDSFNMLASKREILPPKKHGNIPV